MSEISQMSREMTEDLENNFISAQRMPRLKEKTNFYVLCKSHLEMPQK